MNGEFGAWKIGKRKEILIKNVREKRMGGEEAKERNNERERATVGEENRKREKERVKGKYKKKK